GLPWITTSQRARTSTRSCAPRTATTTARICSASTTRDSRTNPAHDTTHDSRGCMSVSHFEVTRRTPFAADYERIDGKLHFAVDPGHPANGRIVDLDKAPCDAAAKVRFWADFVLLQPAE